MSDFNRVNIRIDVLTLLLKIKAGQWEEAHDYVAEREGQADYDRVHALLHRIEGDEWNAQYWYKQANTAFPEESVEDEIESLIKHYSD